MKLIQKMIWNKLKSFSVLIGCFLLFFSTSLAMAQDTLEYKKAPSGEALRILSMKINDRVPDGAQAPAFVLLSGGGWIDFSWSQLKDLARLLAKPGAQAYVVEYRTSKAFPDATPTDALDDVHDAIYYLRQHGKELNLDPDQLILLGASVGGQMAFASCLTNPRKLAPFSKYRPNFIVAFSPVIRNDSLGYGYDRIGAENSWFSPWNIYTETDAKIVPSMIFSGDEDQHIRLEDLERFTAIAKQKGDAVKLIPVLNTGHSMIKYDPEIYEKSAPEISRFLESQGIRYSSLNSPVLYLILGTLVGVSLFVFLVRRRRVKALQE